MAYGHRVLVVDPPDDAQRSAIALPVGARVERLRRGVVAVAAGWRGEGTWAPPQAGDLIYYDDTLPAPAQCYAVGDHTAVPLDAIVAIDSVAEQA